MKRFWLSVLNNFALGVFAGCVLAFGLSWLLAPELGEDLKRFYVFIFSSLLSLIAAAVAAGGVLANIENQNQLAAEDRRRRHVAARAMLPAALAALSEICSKGVRHSERLADEEVADASAWASLKPQLLIPSEVIDVLQSVLSFTEDEGISRRIQMVLREHQIFMARWGDLAEPHWIQTAENRRCTVVSWAYLRFLVGTLYDFARDRETGITTRDPVEGIRSELRQTLINSFEERYEQEVQSFAKNFKRNSVNGN